MEKTFESIEKSLPKRENIIVIKQNMWIPDDICINDLDAFTNKYKNAEEEIFVIGGQSIYETLLPYTSRLYLTEILAEASMADAYFPTFNKDEFSCKKFLKEKYNDLIYERNLYVKK